MPRLPQPTRVLKVKDGQLLEPMPCSAHLRGITPVSYRPAARRNLRRPATPAGPSAAPAGYLDVASAAARLGVPEILLTLRATHEPHRLPTHVLVDGTPYFDPSALPGASA